MKASINRPPANETQFNILKQFASFPGATPQLVAKHFKLDQATIRAVVAAPNYEAWKAEPQKPKLDDKEIDDLFKQFFGDGEA